MKSRSRSQLLAAPLPAMWESLTPEPRRGYLPEPTGGDCSPPLPPTGAGIQLGLGSSQDWRRQPSNSWPEPRLRLVYTNSGTLFFVFFFFFSSHSTHPPPRLLFAGRRELRKRGRGEKEQQICSRLIWATVVFCPAGRKRGSKGRGGAPGEEPV